MPTTTTTTPTPTPPVAMPKGSTGTGLDQLVASITTDATLLRKAGAADVAAGAAAADALNQLLLQAIRATGVANNGDLTVADLYAVNAWIRANRLADWTRLHGNDELQSETGFHLVQADGASTQLYGRNAVDSVADGIYHLGFQICDGRLLNEDGNANASLAKVSGWLGSLLATDLAAGTLRNAALDPYVQGRTGTGLDRLVNLITADAGLNQKIALADIQAGARCADAMNEILLQAIRATGVANDHTLTTADMRDLNAWIRAHKLTEWTALHGDDEDGLETGFHRVQNDGATTQLDGRNAIDTVADGIYHLGFEICGGQLVNEDGNANARLSRVAEGLSGLLATELAGGTLANPAVNMLVQPSTGTGLDQLVNLITADPGLNKRLATSEIFAGASAADAMDVLIVKAIRATGAADGGTIDADEVREINAWLRAGYASTWATLHGDDAESAETGFHLVQGDGASTQLYGRNAVDTVADGLYHLGFAIDKGRLLNEDGDANASLRSVAEWLNALLAADLANGSLLTSAALVGVADTGPPLPGI